MQRYSGSLVVIIEVTCPDPRRCAATWTDGAAHFIRPGGARRRTAVEPDRVQCDDFAVANADRYLSYRVWPALYADAIRLSTIVDRYIVELVQLSVGPTGSDKPTHLAVVHSDIKSFQQLEALSDRIQELTTTCLSAIGARQTGRKFHMVVTDEATVTPVDVTDRRALETARYDPRRARLSWQLARLRSDDPPRGELERLWSSGQLLEPTADVTLALMHDGAALVVVRNPASRDDGDSTFRAWLDGESPRDSSLAFVRWQMHTVITDTVLLGMMQRSGLNSLADMVAQAASSEADVKQMLKMQQEVGRFKASTWWRHVSEEETANAVLEAFRATHRLDDLSADVDRELTLYTSRVQAFSASLSSAAVTILTFTLLPLTVLVAMATSLVPDHASAVVKLLAYLSTIPISLALGVGAAALNPGYLHVFWSMIRARSK